MTRRTLSSVLADGEIVQYTYKGQIFQAYFQSGILVNCDDNTLTYSSPTTFANECSGGSVNGWLQVRVLREGALWRLCDLPADEHLESENNKRSKRMPTGTKTKSVATIALQPVPPKSIIASIIVSNEAPLEITSITRIALPSISAPGLATALASPGHSSSASSSTTDNC